MSSQAGSSCRCGSHGAGSTRRRWTMSRCGMRNDVGSIWKARSWCRGGRAKRKLPGRKAGSHWGRDTTLVAQLLTREERISLLHRSGHMGEISKLEAEVLAPKFGLGFTMRQLDAHLMECLKARGAMAPGASTQHKSTLPPEEPDAEFGSPGSSLAAVVPRGRGLRAWRTKKRLVPMRRAVNAFFDGQTARVFLWSRKLDEGTDSSTIPSRQRGCARSKNSGASGACKRPRRPREAIFCVRVIGNVPERSSG